MSRSPEFFRRVRKAVAIAIIAAFFVNTVTVPGYASASNLRPVAVKQSGKRLNDLGKDLDAENPGRSKDGGVIGARKIYELAFQKKLVKEVVERYRQDNEAVSIDRMPEFGKIDRAKFDKSLQWALNKFTPAGEPLFYDGITVIGRLPKGTELYNFYKAAHDKIKAINDKFGGRNIIVPVVLDSVHMNFYDLLAMREWEPKYSQMNKPMQDEIKKRAKKIRPQVLTNLKLQPGSTGRNVEKAVLMQAAYEVVAEKTAEVLKELKKENVLRAPRFKPMQLSVFYPDGPVTVALSLEPATAEDIAIVAEIQRRIQEATGITNYPDIRVHMPIGYFIDEKFTLNEKDYNSVKGELKKIDDSIKMDAADIIYGHAFSRVELSYFPHMNKFIPLTRLDVRRYVEPPVFKQIADLEQTQSKAESQYVQNYSTEKPPFQHKLEIDRQLYLEEIRSVLGREEYLKFEEDITELEKNDVKWRNLYNNPSAWDYKSEKFWNEAVEIGGKARNISLNFEEIEKKLTRASAGVRNFARELTVRASIVNNADPIFMTQKEQLWKVPVTRIVQRQVGESIRNYASLDLEPFRPIGYGLTEAENPKGSRQASHMHPGEQPERTYSGTDITRYVDYNTILNDLKGYYPELPDKGPIMDYILGDMLYEVDRLGKTEAIRQAYEPGVGKDATLDPKAARAIFDDYITGRFEKFIWEIGKDELKNRLIEKDPKKLSDSLKALFKDSLNNNYTFEAVMQQIGKAVYKTVNEAQGSLGTQDQVVNEEVLSQTYENLRELFRLYLSVDEKARNKSIFKAKVNDLGNTRIKDKYIDNAFGQGKKMEKFPALSKELKRAGQLDLLWRMSQVDIEALETSGNGGHYIRIPLGWVVQTPPGYSHTIRNASDWKGSVDWTLKDLYLQLFKMAGSQSTSGQFKVVAPEKITGHGWERYSNRFPNMISEVETDAQGNVIFEVDENGLNNPKVKTRMNVRFDLINVAKNGKTSRQDFRPLKGMVQMLRLMPWPSNLDESWDIKSDRQNVKADVTVFRKDGSSETISLVGGEQLIMNNDVPGSTPIVGYSVTNTSNKNYEIMLVTPYRETIAQAIKGIDLERTALIFNVNDTLLKTKQRLSDDPDLMQQLIQALDSNAIVGIISNNSYDENRYRILDVLSGELKKINKIDLLNNLIFYANGGATKVTYDVRGDPTIKPLNENMVSMSEYEGWIKDVVRAAMNNRFNLSPASLKETKRFYGIDEDEKGNFIGKTKDERWIGKIADFENVEFDVTWLKDPKQALNIETINPKIFIDNILKKEKDPESEPMLIQSPWVENRDNVELSVKLIPSFTDAAGADVRLAVRQALEEQLEGKGLSVETGGFASIDITRVGKDLAVQDLLREHGGHLRNAFYFGDAFKARGGDTPVSRVADVTVIAVDKDRSQIESAVFQKTKAFWTGDEFFDENGAPLTGPAATKAVLNKILADGGTAVNSRDLARELNIKLQNKGSLTQDDREALDKAYKLDQDDFDIDHPELRWPTSEEQVAGSRLKFKPAVEVADQLLKSKPIEQFFPGDTVISHYKDLSGGYKLFEDLNEAIVKDEKGEKDNKKILALVYKDSVHITLSDLVSIGGDWEEKLGVVRRDAFVDKKVNYSVVDSETEWDNLLQAKVIDEWGFVIDKKYDANVKNDHVLKTLKKLLNEKKQIRDDVAQVIKERAVSLVQQSKLDLQAALQQATFEVIAENTADAIQELIKTGAFEKAPVFVPYKIAVAHRRGPGAIVINMKPKTAEDLIMVYALQDKIMEKTGIKNFYTFKAHVSLGYIINPINDVKKFESLMKKLQEKVDVSTEEFELSKIELCYFAGMNKFAPIATYDWTGLKKSYASAQIKTKLLDKQKIENARFQKDGGEKKIKVAVIGGTGNIGKPIVNRLKQKGQVDVLIGSRKADPARGIMTNEEAAAIADVVFVTVPVEAFFDQVEKLVPLMKPGATFVSMGVAINKAQKDMLGAQYRSVAEKVDAIIRQKAADKNIVVVAAMHNVPGEWHADPMLRLTQDIIVLSNDRARAEFVSERVISQISALNPIYCGGLDKACYAEQLTPAIIRTDKELLRGRSLKDLFDFVASQDGKVEVADIQQYNREVLDKEILALYFDPQILGFDLAALDSASVSIRQKEYIAIAMTRYLEIIPQGSSAAQRVQEALDRYNAPLLDQKIYQASEKEFAPVVNTLPSIKDAKAAMIIGANVILENAGAIAAIKNIKQMQPGINIVVWSADGEAARTLKTLGVDKSANLVAVERLQDLLKRVRKDVPDQNKIVLINSAKDLEAIKSEFKVSDPEMFIRTDLKVNSVSVQAPQPAQARSINDMALVMGRALAMMFKNEASVLTKYQEMIRTYYDKKKISESDMAALSDLTVDLKDIPLAKVSEKLAGQQASYIEAVTRI